MDITEAFTLCEHETYTKCSFNIHGYNRSHSYYVNMKRTLMLIQYHGYNRSIHIM